MMVKKSLGGYKLLVLFGIIYLPLLCISPEVDNSLSLHAGGLKLGQKCPKH